MTPVISQRSYSLPPISLSEVLRYSGCARGSDDTEALALRCISECEGVFCGSVCFGEFNARVSDGKVDLGFAEISSNDLARVLDGCTSVIVFAATVGLEIDRLIKKYSVTSPAKAVILGAVGAERIEALCDEFCRDTAVGALERGLTVRPRFSPGYGDLPIELQKDIFRVLDCPKRIGATLNSSLLISPSKSVTAIVGLKKRA